MKLNYTRITLEQFSKYRFTTSHVRENFSPIIYVRSAIASIFIIKKLYIYNINTNVYLFIGTATTYFA